MKKYLSIGAAILLAAVNSHSQTVNRSNPVPGWQMATENIISNIFSGTNWSAVVGYGRSTAHMVSNRGKNLAFADVAYGFSQNVGIIFGYDYLWAKGLNEQNTVKGGLTLQDPIRIFSFLGSTFLTNTVGTPWIGDALATPKGNNSLGNLFLFGVNFEAYPFSNMSVDLGIFGENRSGQGPWDGNYLAGHVGITRRF